MQGYRKYVALGLALLMFVALFAVGGCAAKDEVTETPAATEPAATEPAATEPAAAGALSITGAIPAPIEMTLDDVKALGLVKKTVEHPKKGPTEYEGVLMSALLEKIGATGATSLKLTASDGYSAEIAIADITSSPDSMFEVDADGKLNAVLPSLSTQSWVGDTIAIEVK